jgi:hypothetical protein
METQREFKVEELLGPAEALWLDRIPAFEGIAAAFTTTRTLGEGAAASFRRPALTAAGEMDEEYIARLAAAAGFPYGRLATGRQVHGTHIARHAVAERRWFDRCDGLATDLAAAPVAVFTADCVPVLLWAPAVGALAMLHAGWRGTVAKIAAAGVAYLARTWGARAEEIMAFLGPAVGVCCYEVGPEVAAATREAFGARARQLLSRRGAAYHLDLQRANELAAQEAGVLPDNIYRVAACTAHDDLFPSYRRDGAGAGRSMAVAQRGPAAPGGGE